MADLENGWKDIRVEMHGVGSFGQLVRVPSDLSAVLTMHQPHQVDTSIRDALDPWQEAFGAQIRGLAPDVALKSLNSVSGLEANLDDSLHAARYHQRQFLCRFRDVDARHRQSRTTATAQLEIVMNDLPLRCEIEAFLVRVSSSLDALGQLLGLILTGKPKKWGEFVTSLPKRRDIDSALRFALQDIIDQQAGWMAEARNYRHAIVHEAELAPFRGPAFGAHGVASAAVAKEDAGDFVLRIWTNLRTMMHAVAQAMYTNRNGWALHPA